MATPTLVTVQGTYLKLDGTAETGSVRFESQTFARHSASDDVVSPGALTATLDASGDVTLVVPATDDPAWSPVGWTYRVTMQLSGVRREFDAAIPYDTPGGVLDLSDLLPAQPADGELYAAYAHTHAAYAADASVVHVAGVETITGLKDLAAGFHVGDRYQVSATGGMDWGPVGGPVDVNFYRAGVGLLQTDYTFNAAAFRLNGADVQTLLDGKLSLTGGTVTGNVTVQGAGGTKSYGFRTNGSNLDLEGSGADLFLSVWSGAGATGTQRNYARLEAGAQLFHALSRWVWASTAFASTFVLDVDPSTGVVVAGGKNSLAGIRLCGMKATAGAPTTGTWAAGDLIIDAAGVWHLCTVAGTPGTWT
jgi:hypothetical protein